MTRLTIIGNSHVAAYKLGWDAVRDRWPGIEIEFFAAPGRNFQKLELRDRRYLGASEAHSEIADPRLHAGLHRVNGRTEIDLDAADRVIWVGWGHRIDADFTALEAVAELLAGFEIDGLAKPRRPGLLARIGLASPSPETEPARPMSRPAFDAICGALAARLLPGQAWRDWPPGRLFFSPIHRPADAVLKQKSALGKRWRRFVRSGEGAQRGLDLFAASLEAQLAAIGITMVRQPAATLGRHGLTRAELTRGSLYFSGTAHPETDVYHMNADFGVLCLEALFAQLGLAGRAPAASEPGAPERASAHSS